MLEHRERLGALPDVLSVTAINPRRSLRGATNHPEDVMKISRTAKAVIVTGVVALGVVGISIAPASAQPKERGGDCAYLMQTVNLYTLKEDLWEGLAQMYANNHDTAGFNDAIDNATFWVTAVSGAKAEARGAGCM